MSVAQKDLKALGMKPNGATPKWWNEPYSISAELAAQMTAEQHSDDEGEGGDEDEGEGGDDQGEVGEGNNYVDSHIKLIDIPN